jgi:imidazolonepropionase-like amidohydrolase
MARFAGELENASRTTPKKLLDAGIRFAFQSGYESYVPKTRVVLYEAAISTAYGLTPDAALRAITLDAARILGLDARLGSLEVGKDGDLALYDGDPFEYTTHCIATIIEGAVVFEGAR